ncbi:MAG: hypothetical protein JXB32_05110, partial [Deltaproteobacteria bacterium]|nr:hypothetical protein [Deltaproteobacteria bacterium]
ARHVCLGSGSAARCNRFCFSDADCDLLGATSQCVYGVVDSGGMEIPGFDVCSEQCDVLADTVCPATGEACRLGSFTGHAEIASYCGGVGAGGQGASCATGGASACQAGHACFNVTGYGSICLRQCRFPSGTPSCPVSTTCTAPSGYPSGVGVCIPS